ncbi:hypothetical protein TB2_021272 [Malus domestica]
MAKAEPDAFVSPTDLAPQLLTTNPISAPTLTWSPTVGVEIKLKRMVVTDETLELIAKSFKNFKLLVLLSCEGFNTDGFAAMSIWATL